MNLKQRFLTQSTLILIGTIVITCCFGFTYTYFYNLLSKSPDSSGLGHRAIVVMENDSIDKKSEFECALRKLFAEESLKLLIDLYKAGYNLKKLYYDFLDK